MCLSKTPTRLTRLWLFPSKNWPVQVSVGRITHPEALESGDQVRATASLHYSKPMQGTESECIRPCVNGPHGDALYDGTNVMKLSDQKSPMKYAAQKAKVIGTYDAKAKKLKVVSIEAAE